MVKFVWMCGASALLVCAAFQAPEAKPKVVTGVLLNAADRTPIPEYTFVLQPTVDPLAPSVDIHPPFERLTTDAKGRFEGVRPFPIGSLEFTPVDWESTEFSGRTGGLLLPPHASMRFPVNSAHGSVSYEDLATASITHTGKPLEILMPCGPTFDVTLKPLEIEKNGPALAASRARLIATTSGAVDEGVALTTRVRTLDAHHGWARFPALPKNKFAKPHGARFELVTVDGRWKAVADVTEQLAKGTRKVDLEWQPCSRWTGVLQGIETTMLAPNWITAERVGEDGSVLERLRVRVEPGGGFQFMGIDAGRWRLATQPLRAKAFTSEVRELTFEKPIKEPIRVERIETKLGIRVRVTGGPVPEGTTEHSISRLVLRRARDPLPVDEARLEWTAHDGRWTADFTFTELPEGEFEVDLDTDDGALFEKTTLPARSGGADVIFETR